MDLSIASEFTIKKKEEETMKIKNGYAKLAETLGLELGQEFIIVADGRRYPYYFDSTGLYNANGERNSHPLHQLLSGELDIEITPLLTLKESSYLRTLYTICDDIYAIRLSLDSVGHKVMNCVAACGMSVVDIMIADDLFEKLSLNRKYTWKELGLEG